MGDFLTSVKDNGKPLRRSQRRKTAHEERDKKHVELSHNINCFGVCYGRGSGKVMGSLADGNTNNFCSLLWRERDHNTYPIYSRAHLAERPFRKARAFIRDKCTPFYPPDSKTLLFYYFSLHHSYFCKLHIANSVVLRENAMYRTLLATCGSEEMILKNSISVLTPCNENTHFLWATRCKQRAVHYVFNENELRTHTLQATCGTLPYNEILSATVAHQTSVVRNVETRHLLPLLHNAVPLILSLTSLGFSHTRARGLLFLLHK